MAPRTHRLQGVRRVDEVRNFCGFALVGLANTILPFLVHSANYLIIPYPQPVVAAIRLLPALAIKLLLPQLLRLVPIPYRARPFIFAVAWIAARIVTWATPPNIVPILRILNALLATAAATCTEVSALGLLRCYGRTGLAGWGLGTGLGGMAVAAMPAFLTLWQGRTIRDGMEYILTFAAVVVLAFLLVLPDRSIYDGNDRKAGSGRDLDADDFDLDSPGELRQDRGLLLEDPLGKRGNVSHNIKQNIDYAASLYLPYMYPLLATFRAASIVFPGIVRAQGNGMLGDLLRYSTAYGLIFNAGSVIGRSSVLFLLASSWLRPLLMAMGVAAGLAVVNAWILLNSVIAFVIVFFLGLFSGTVYVNVFASVLEETPHPDDREFALQTVGAGETAGQLTGVWAGALFEWALCSLPPDGGRWCHMSR